MKFLSNLFICGVFCLSIMVVSQAIAVEGSVYNQQDELSKGTYSMYLNELQVVKTQLKAKANDLGKMTECHKQGKLYTSTGCENSFNPEIDPSAKAHTQQEPYNCAANEVQLWSAGAWGCKEIRNSKPITGIPNQPKWKMENAENCGDVYMRPCEPTDDNCPGVANPDDKNCAVQGTICRYVNNTQNFTFFRCGSS